MLVVGFMLACLLNGLFDFVNEETLSTTVQGRREPPVCPEWWCWKAGRPTTPQQPATSTSWLATRTATDHTTQHLGYTRHYRQTTALASQETDPSRVHFQIASYFLLTPIFIVACNKELDDFYMISF